MAKDEPRDATKALEFKEKGNRCFQSGDYKGAESCYTQAYVSILVSHPFSIPPSIYSKCCILTTISRINHDPTNPTFYTNRATSLLKLHDFEPVISDSLQAITLLPENMKAYYNLAQAQIALSHPGEALSSAKKAHELCVKEVHAGTKGGSSITMITELVLRCKKEGWERREKARERSRGGLELELVGLLEKQLVKEEDVLISEGRENEKEDLKREFEQKIEELRSTFEMAKLGGEAERRKKVPDWVVDDITFGVMFDPVVVCFFLAFLSCFPFLYSLKLFEANIEIDKNWTIIRSLFDYGTSQTKSHRSIDQRTSQCKGSTTQPRSQSCV